MSHFAVRRTIPAVSPGEAGQFTPTPVADEPHLLASYWTPSNRQLLSIYEKAPAVAGTEAELLSVLPITADEYGPPAMAPAAGDGRELGLVLVRRHLEPQTDRQFRAVALQAITCAFEYTDLLWLRSYWATEQNELLCLFRTRTHSLVREHAHRSRIPCDEFHDAVEIAPASALRTATGVPVTK
jgi:hypothetical protein